MEQFHRPQRRLLGQVGKTLLQTVKTFAIYAGAVICLGMMSGRFQDAIPALFGALFGAGVLG
jgi:hypothetical protein